MLLLHPCDFLNGIFNSEFKNMSTLDFLEVIKVNILTVLLFILRVEFTSELAFHVFKFIFGNHSVFSYNFIRKKRSKVSELITNNITIVPTIFLPCSKTEIAVLQSRSSSPPKRLNNSFLKKIQILVHQNFSCSFPSFGSSDD